MGYSRIRVFLKDSLLAVIPETVTFVTAATASVNVGALSPYYIINYFRPKETILPTFVCDNEHKSIKKASKAALHAYSNVQSKAKKTISNTVHQNIPMTNLKIVGSIHELDQNSFHVVNESGFCLTMIKDVFMEALMNSPIENGTFKGEFIFAQINSKELTLIRVGSYLHKLVEASNARKDKPKLTSYEEGDVVTCKKGIRAVYLGQCVTKRATLSGSNFDFTFYDKKTHVFYLLNMAEQETRVNRMNRMDWYSKIELQPSPLFVEKIGKVELKPGMIEKVRKFERDEFMKELMEFAGNGNVLPFLQISKKELIDAFLKRCPKMCLSKIGEPLVEPIDIANNLLFI